MSEEVKVRDFEIPVPWGVMAGQEWLGRGHTWIALHGWMDNSGSLDGVAKLLAEAGYRVISLDLPGHGFSSHYPPGIGYNFMDNVVHVRRAVKHFNLNRFSLIGHSMGGGVCSAFAATHPQLVEHLVSLDMICPLLRPLDDQVSRARAAVDSMFLMEDKLKSGKEPVHTYKNAKIKLMSNYGKMHGDNALTSEAADTLLKRGLRKSACGEGFVFTRDLKNHLKGLYGYPFEIWSKFAESIQCPHLIITAATQPEYFQAVSEELAKVVKVYKTSNPKFTLSVADGNHFVHLNSPTTVYKFVEEMLMQYPVSDLTLEDV